MQHTRVVRKLLRDCL